MQLYYLLLSLVVQLKIKENFIIYLNNLALGKPDRELDIVWDTEIFIAVNEGFVEIKNYCFFDYGKL